MKWLSRLTAATLMATALASGAQEPVTRERMWESPVQDTRIEGRQTQEAAGLRAHDDQEPRTAIGAKDDEIRAPHYRWELAIPDHLPKEARYPQHLLPGRKIRIVPINGAEAIPGSARLSIEGAAQAYALETKTKADGSFTLELPRELPPGNHTLTIGESKLVLPFPIVRKPVTGDPIGIPIMRPRRDILRLDCGNCYWEAAIYQDQSDPLRGALLGNSRSLITTTDGWRTTTARSIDDLVAKPNKPYFCDPKFTTLTDGRMAFVGLTLTPGEAITGAVWIADKAVTKLEQTVIGPIVASQNSIVMDYPKIVVDTDTASKWYGTAYVSANSTYFLENNGWVGTGLLTFRDGTVRKARGIDIGMWQPPQSGAVLHGVVHFGRDDFTPEGKPQMTDYVSTDGGASFTSHGIAETHAPSFARVSTASNRGWILYRGPQLVADKEHGILYAAWADYEQSVPDKDFEYGTYGMNYDLFVARSFDDGKTWSAKVKVNDDTGKGDQGYPSIAIDKDGAVYVSFFDHRYRQDQAVYDVYLAKSNDFGATFGPNYKVNDYPVPNGSGGRNPGDYLDMIGIAQENVNVFHPCVGRTTDPWGPTDACITRIPKETIPNAKK